MGKNLTLPIFDEHVRHPRPIGVLAQKFAQTYSVFLEEMRGGAITYVDGGDSGPLNPLLRQRRFEREINQRQRQRAKCNYNRRERDNHFAGQTVPVGDYTRPGASWEKMCEVKPSRNR